MRIVVTGGAGFLGRHLCIKLLSLGHSVLCIDNLITGNRRNVVAIEQNRAFEFQNRDVSEPFEVEGEIEAVVHMASPASPPDYLQFPIETLKVGSLGTHNALELAKQKEARFLLTSTSEVYGDPLVSPQPEEYWGNVNNVGPRSVYDEAKRYAEALTLAYHRKHGVDVRIARIFNTYGPWMRSNDGRVISNFVVQALNGKKLTVYGDGKQTRSFCYVSDLIEGLVRLLLADSGANPSIHTPINLGNPNEMKIIDIARLILNTSGSSSQVEFLPLPVDDPKRRCPDISRARRWLGWEPAVSLEKGLEATIQYFRESGEGSQESGKL